MSPSTRAAGAVAVAAALGLGLGVSHRAPAATAQAVAERQDEAAANRLGYALLRKGDTAGALDVLRRNAERHPGSANVHDSLGEAYVAAGRKAEAIASYRRAVAIAPRKKSAAAALAQLTGERRPLSPMVLFHVVMGTAGVISGFLALTLRKGSRRHARVGVVFAVSMLAMSSTGAAIAYLHPHSDPINVLMGFFTFYLVATSWRAARRREDGVGGFEQAAALAALGLVVAFVDRGVAAVDGGALYFFFGAFAALAAGLDVRMILRGGVVGAPRLTRHLWRMCAALLIGVSSLFLGQPQVFPEAIRRSGLLALPSLAVLAVLVFWLIRVKSTRRPRPDLLSVPERTFAG